MAPPKQIAKILNTSPAVAKPESPFLLRELEESTTPIIPKIHPNPYSHPVHSPTIPRTKEATAAPFDLFSIFYTPFHRCTLITCIKVIKIINTCIKR